MRIWIPTLPVVLLAAAAGEADAQTLCTRATMNDAAAGQIVEESFRYGGTDRFLCTYLPSSIGDGALHPLMIALHGGSGNASQMMADNHGIIAAAEAAGYVAVFPNGLPRGACGALPCLDNNWSQPENVFFVAELIERQKATGRIDDDRVHLVGFSGGAKLIYDIVATPGFPHAINSVATVAGAFGLFHVGRPEEGFDVTQLQEGTPVSALLVQGALDDHLPAAGGLDHTGPRVARVVPNQGRLLAPRHRHRRRACAGDRRAGARSAGAGRPRGVPLHAAGRDRGRDPRPRPAPRLARLERHGRGGRPLRAELMDARSADVRATCAHRVPRQPDVGEQTVGQRRQPRLIAAARVGGREGGYGLRHPASRSRPRAPCSVQAENVHRPSPIWRPQPVRD